MGKVSDAAVKIPKGITEIAADAFSGSSIGSVIFPEGVIKIGSNAFKECRKLQKVQLPKSLQSIGSNAFWNCTSLKRITIPDNVKTIGVMAFFGCGSLMEVVMSPALMPGSDNYKMPASCNIKSTQDIVRRNDIHNQRSKRSDDSLLECLRQHGIKIDDKRPKGGALWITGDEQLIKIAIQKTMEEFGAEWAYSEKRGAYYTKCKK